MRWNSHSRAAQVEQELERFGAGTLSGDSKQSDVQRAVNVLLPHDSVHVSATCRAFKKKTKNWFLQDSQEGISPRGERTTCPGH